jgi:dTDP-glucose 4,6-dehydratase
MILHDIGYRRILAVAGRSVAAACTPRHPEELSAQLIYCTVQTGARSGDGTTLKNLLVTGGAGFVGSALIRQLIDETESTVVNVDALTYAANPEALEDARESSRYAFEHMDIRDRSALDSLFRRFRPDAVVHIAAESHVDRSIRDATPFVETNVSGTCSLLEAARMYRSGLDPEAQAAFRFLQVSTDEVYGDLGPADPAFTEATPYSPNSPYAASKAGADHLARAWHRTYGLPVLVTHSCNNYGRWQYPEKLIPLTITNALAGKALPVYGRGDNVREWLHVDDHAAGLRLVLDSGAPGSTYNIGGEPGLTNLQVVRTICTLLDGLAPRAGGPYADLIEFVADRPGHDRRYAVDDSRIRHELGWQPRVSFESGLTATVKWHLDCLRAGSGAGTVDDVRSAAAVPGSIGETSR